MNKKVVLQIDLFGDLSLNGLLCDPQYIAELKVNLANFSEQLSESNLRFVNWESPISSSNYDFHKSKKTILATTLDSAKAFTDVFDIDVAILGNNHVADCRLDGVETTMSFLDSKKIFHTGVSTNNKKLFRPLVLSKNGISIGVLSYVGSETNPNIEKDIDIYINQLDKVKIIEDIKSLRSKVDIIIVALHWGDEFISYPSMNQQSLARSLIDAGAGIIYGHHTHCLQGMEKWKNGLIFYSLGNFIFSGLKGKESSGWPRISTISGYYQVFILDDYSFKYFFIPFKTMGSNISLNKNNTSIYENRQLRLSQELVSNYKIRRKINIFFMSLVILPVFFYKSKGGLIGTILSIKKDHFKLLFRYLFSEKSR